MQKFGDNTSKFDGNGSYITIPDKDIDFKINNLQEFEAWSWIDENGRFHFEINVLDNKRNIFKLLKNFILNKINNLFIKGEK